MLDFVYTSFRSHTHLYSQEKERVQLVRGTVVILIEAKYRQILNHNLHKNI